MDIPTIIPLEYDLRPAYYDEFHCLAEDCRLTCCKGWCISFDKKDFMALKRQTGSQELNTRMHNILRRIRNNSGNGTQYGEFRLREEDGCCPLHCDNGLCLLQREKGHEVLPWVCRVFPRAEIPSRSGYVERSLSPACEAVLELLWDLPEGVDFRSDPLPRPQTYSDTAHGILKSHFQEIRSLCIDLLQDRRLPLPHRILLMGLALRSLAEGENDLSLWMERVQLLSEQNSSVSSLLTEEEAGRYLPNFLINNIRIIYSFPEKTDDFTDLRQVLTSPLEAMWKGGEIGKGSYTLSAELYLDARARFQERFAQRDYFMENLMVTIFFQLRFPEVDSPKALWRSYVNFCNLYSVYRYLSVMSCRDGAAGDQEELFRLMVYGSRKMIHNGVLPSAVCDAFFQNESATLAHMAVLLSN